MVAIVFMVAGMSSRFGGKPKQLEKVGPNNETLIEISVNQALKNNFSELIFITNKNTENLFMQIFGTKYNNILVKYFQQNYNSLERKRPWGTTDAICILHDYLKTSFILVNGDDIYGDNTFKTGFELMSNNNINIIGVSNLLKTLPESGIVNRGIVYVNDTKVEKLEERIGISRENKELLNNYANVNFIGLQPNVLSLLNNILIKFKEKNKENFIIECLLPNNISELINNGKIEMDYFIITDEILGITNPGDEIIIRNKLKII